jgi:hypothetical protein
MRKPEEFENFPNAIVDDPRWRGALWRFMSVRKYLTDGDTAWFVIDKGLRSYDYLPIRCDGYDAWELFRGTPEVREKGLLAKNAFDVQIPYNGCVGLITSEGVSLDRWVASVLYVNAEGKVEDLKVYMENNGHTKVQILAELYGE